MKSILSCLLMIIAIASSSCREESPSPAMPVPAAEEDPLARYPAEEVEGSGIVPMDPSISPEAAAIDERAAELELRSTTLDPEQPGWEPRLIRGWFDQGRLVRLSVTEPTDAGRMSGESIWYLATAQPFLVRTPGAIYELDESGDIVAALDESGSPVQLSATGSQEQARSLRASFERWNDALIDSSPVPAAVDPAPDDSV